MGYRIETFPNGQKSLKDLNVGQCMHSTIGPMEEAKLVYIEQSQLKRRVLDSETQNPIVIYDIGLGIGANSLAALECFEECHSFQRPIHMVSFETEIQGMHYALENQGSFEFVEKHRPQLEGLLQKGFWGNPNSFFWELKMGDFRQNLKDLPPPELIFYDLFSPQTCPELWGYQTFKLLYEATLGKRCMFITYSSATSVRSALGLAGFSVGYGISTHGKRGTTIASTDGSELSKPFGPEWLEHLKRSQKPWPYDAPQSL